MENNIIIKPDKLPEDNILISVIIPVYNAEEYLSDCLSSMTKQGFVKEQYEIIIVNDGSTDNSESIIKRYCAQFDYMRLINTENQGVSKARNIGIQNASGKYIAFVDADDAVCDNCYHPMIQIMEKEALNGFCFACTNTLDDLSRFKGKYEIVDKYFTIPVWSMIYRRDILISNNILFDIRISMMEDYLFNYLFTQLSGEGFGVTNEKCYYYRDNTDSICHTYLNNPGDITKRERIYNSIKLVCITIKNSLIDYHFEQSYFYRMALSSVILSLLWYAMRAEMEPSFVISDLEKSGINLSDITVKSKEGTSFKMKTKSNIQYAFRHPAFYKSFCKVYQKVIKIRK